MRTGIGYDIHRFKKGRKLVLGGVDVEYKLGLDGHSDADVIIHSLCDALLGAAALGDIGNHFPDTDPQFKNISSIKLLGEVKEKIRGTNSEVNNIDITVICESPKLSGYIPEMIKKISQVMEIPAYDINIKATTNEKVGDIGKGEAIAALAVATVIPSAGLNQNKK